jgi:uncharacterized membrane protein YeiH
MRYERFHAWFRKEFDWTFWSIVAVVSVMWGATILDFALGLGWGWDKEVLWVAPLILLTAFVVRIWKVVIDKLVDRFRNGS